MSHTTYGAPLMTDGGFDENTAIVWQQYVWDVLVPPYPLLPWRSSFTGDATVPFFAIRPDLPLPSGNTRHWIISGIARDSTGAVLAGATVKAYRTSDDTYQGAATSAADGAYSVGVDSSGNHYVVAYLAGSPDTAGTSVNTLTGV